ncbi:hypothetical protein [Streptomyces sp. NPDC057854]|uniref:hypothetical protein n=1 Tax=unclassified Streptomyces TaxID=2593676 RepID=UPI0036BC5F3B
MENCARCDSKFSPDNTRDALKLHYPEADYHLTYQGAVCFDCVDDEIDNGLDGEVWFECEECEGTKKVSVPYEGDERVSTLEDCPNCGALGFWQGTTDDLPSDRRRIFDF